MNGQRMSAVTVDSPDLRIPSLVVADGSSIIIHFYASQGLDGWIICYQQHLVAIVPHGLYDSTPKVWCERRESNSYALRHGLLRPAWLPLHHSRMFFTYTGPKKDTNPDEEKYRRVGTYIDGPI